MAGTTGLEPATSAVTGQRSNQLSYVPNLALSSVLACSRTGHTHDDKLESIRRRGTMLNEVRGNLATPFCRHLGKRP